MKHLNIVAAIALAVSSAAAGAQASSGNVNCPKDMGSVADHANMDHSAHLAMLKRCEAGKLSVPAQAAFGAISEIVRLLEADSSTDWSKVNIEALRQHLIDMDDVMMRSTAVQREVASGLEIKVTGTGRTVGAIQRMVVNHARMLDEGTEYSAKTEQLRDGVRLTITAKSKSDSKTIARIRGLGFAGLLTEGDHHAVHHLALARGEAHPHR